MFQLIAAIAIAASPVTVAELYGDLREGEKYLVGVKLQLTCGTETAEATTDKSGSFRLSVKASGKCVLKVTYQDQTPTLEVVLFDQPARYRLQLELQNGKYVLKRQ